MALISGWAMCWLAVGAAAAPDVPPDGARVLWQRSLTDDAQRGREACAWDGKAWSCRPEILAHFSVLATATAAGDTRAVVEVAVVEDDACVQGVEVAVRGQSAPLELDWSQVSLRHNGTPVASVAGINRKIQLKVQPAGVKAPATRVVRQRFFPAQAEVCLAPSVDGISVDQPDILEVAVPHQVGGVSSEVRWRLTRAWVSAEEKDVFSSVPEPVRVTAAAPDLEPGNPATLALVGLFTLWGPAACAVPILGVLAMGVGIDLLNRSNTQTALWVFLVGSGALLGLFCAPACALLGVAGVAADVLFGLAYKTFGLGWLGGGTSVNDDKARAARVKQEQMQHDAWVDKRRQLGISGASAASENLN